MKTINLKKYYYPICKKDTFVEVPDEVADAIVEESRAETPTPPSSYYTVTLWTHPPAWNTISRSRPFPRRIFWWRRKRNGNRRPPAP